MPDESESTRRRKKPRGATPRAKRTKREKEGPLGAREPRQLSPEELEALRQRLQRKYR